jgi:hypothetical protein
VLFLCLKIAQANFETHFLEPQITAPFHLSLCELCAFRGLKKTKIIKNTQEGIIALK